MGSFEPFHVRPDATLGDTDAFTRLANAILAWLDAGLSSACCGAPRASPTKLAIVSADAARPDTALRDWGNDAAHFSLRVLRLRACCILSPEACSQGIASIR